MNLLHFTLDEFDSPDEPGSGSKMNGGFIGRLDSARDLSEFPWVITSGYRTKAHNDKVGGIDSSAHTRGYAVDIKCQGSARRYEIIKSLIKSGFTRIGVASNFIHVDDDPDKSSQVIWTY